MKKHLQPKKGKQIQQQRDNSVDTKEMRGSTANDPILFSFCYFDKSQIPPGQSFTEWAQQSEASNFLREVQKLLKASDTVEGGCEEQAFKLLELFEKLQLMIAHFFDNADAASANTPRLALFCDLLVDLSNKTRHEAETGTGAGIIKTYGKFPPTDKTEFHLPIRLQDGENLQWATIRKIDGGVTRVAGFWEGNVFYIVFLDADHVFWKSTKKHT